MNYIIGNVVKKCITITTNPIIGSIGIQIINNTSNSFVNSNAYNNDTIIIDLLLSMVVVLLLIIII